MIGAFGSGNGDPNVRGTEAQEPMTKDQNGMDLQLTDKVAIVTGSTRGLGFATARALLGEGCNVTICARGEEGLAGATAELRSVPGGQARVLAVQADLATDKGVADVVMRTVETFGGLDILVNNVGLAKGAGIIGHDRRRVAGGVRPDAVSGDPRVADGGAATCAAAAAGRSS